MAQTVTFLHAADLHLGAPFRGLRHSSEIWATRLEQALSEAYTRLVSAAIDRSVDFVILAGDIFDSLHPSYSDYLVFLQGLQRLADADIPVYFCTGNHDPYVSWPREFGRLPDNTHMFSATGPSYFTYRRSGAPLAVLAGRGFYTQQWPEGEDVIRGMTRVTSLQAVEQDAPFVIGVIHTGLDVDARIAPVSMGALKRTGMNYWALGHIHRPQILDDEANPHIVYSGNIQGCAIDEPGPRGAAIVTLRENRPNHLEFVPLSSVIWEAPSINVATCESLTDVANTVAEKISHIRASFGTTPLIVRVSLCGSTRLHHALKSDENREALRSQLNAYDSAVYYDAIVDRTSSVVDKGRLGIEGTFAGTFLEVMKEQNSDRQAALTYLESQFTARGLSLPHSVGEQLDDLQAEAEALVLEKLVLSDYE